MSFSCINFGPLFSLIPKGTFLEVVDILKPLIAVNLFPQKVSNTLPSARNESALTGLAIRNIFI